MCKEKKFGYDPNLVSEAMLNAKSAEFMCSPHDEGAWDLWEMEKLYIRNALDHFDGDKVRASKALGISLSSLYRKLDIIMRGE